MGVVMQSGAESFHCLGPDRTEIYRLAKFEDRKKGAIMSMLVHEALKARAKKKARK